MGLQARQTYEAMKRYPGRSSKELSRLAQLDRHAAARRCSDLWRKGAALKVEIGKRDCLWYAIL